MARGRYQMTRRTRSREKRGGISFDWLLGYRRGKGMGEVITNEQDIFQWASGLFDKMERDRFPPSFGPKLGFPVQ